MKKEKEIKEEIITGDNLYSLDDYNAFYYKGATGNCKHCYLDHSSYLIEPLKTNTKNVLKYLKKIFEKNSKVTFAVNLTSKIYIDTISKYFTLISCVNIPTGYNNKFQYHAIFFTNCNSRDADGLYRKRFKKLLDIQKKEEEKIISDKIIKKILSYKSKYWLKIYLQKLIS